MADWQDRHNYRRARLGKQNLGIEQFLQTFQNIAATCLVPYSREMAQLGKR